MVEIPANVVLAGRFAERFCGFSIGTNDLTQLVLGVDRDSEELSYLYDERNEPVKRVVANLIESAHQTDTRVGICGQAPSDYPGFAAFLVEEGIASMSPNRDSVIQVKRRVGEQESR
jgi:pyruvate,water dikinase